MAAAKQPIFNLYSLIFVSLPPKVEFIIYSGRKVTTYNPKFKIYKFKIHFAASEKSVKVGSIK